VGWRRAKTAYWYNLFENDEEVTVLEENTETKG